MAAAEQHEPSASARRNRRRREKDRERPTAAEHQQRRDAFAELLRQRGFIELSTVSPWQTMWDRAGTRVALSMLTEPRAYSVEAEVVRANRVSICYTVERLAEVIGI